jgi:23S rRNA-/tRNA-specific pseudouridylate synthase
MYSKISIMKSTIYHNKDFMLIRKPHGIPSTFGKVESFLDRIKKQQTEHAITWTPLSALVPSDVFPFISSRVKDLEEVGSIEELEEILSHQVDTFGQEQEFGLLNRLDNETAGFLYFAKNIEAFTRFKSLQKSNQVKKYYLAQIEGMLKSGNVETWKGEKIKSFNPSTLQPFNINFPIMHHRSIPEKMIAIRDSKDIRL